MKLKLRYFKKMLFGVFIISSINSQAVFAQDNSDAAIEKKVKTLLNKMTLEDKVGEMTQLSIDVLCVGQPYNLTEPHRFDEEKLKKVLVDLKVGSILNVGGHAYTREHWKEVITRIQDIATKEKKSGIPVIYGIDAIHGANYTMGSTLFPQQIALAATFNTELAETMGSVTAYEVRASGITWNFSPVLGLGREPVWSRFWETFGEDVYLASTMGDAMIRGYQGNDASQPTKVAACMKHFLGYSVPINGKDRSPAWIPERQLQEYFVPSFQAAVDAGVLTVMINSGEMNGIPVHCNPKILKDLLRTQLGFKGLAVTDWEDIGYLVSRHRVAKDFKDGIRLAINAGIDMAMVPMDLNYPILLKELVEEGKVPMSRIDESVSRILYVKYKLGLFENAYFPFEDYDKFGSEEFINAAYHSAQEAITLLKNDNDVLPLSKTAKVLVTGPTASSQNALNGAWSRTWQGTETKYDTPGKLTIAEAIRERLGAEQVVYVEGTTIEDAKNIEEAAKAAKEVDAAIVCLGEMPYCEKPGDIDELDLPAAQIELIKAVAEAGKPVILVIVEGRPRIVREAEEAANAVVMAYLPGEEGGKAITDVLFGDYNPNGKLPFTYPKYANTHMTYDHKGTDLAYRDFSMNGFQPQWEFGHGMSYTSFKYSDLRLGSKTLNKNGKLTISAKITNTGDRAGKESVLLFVTDNVASITPPAKRLRAYQKIDLKAGESKVVTFEISPEDLAFVGLENKWITEAGAFTVRIGDLEEEFIYED